MYVKHPIPYAVGFLILGWMLGNGNFFTFNRDAFNQLGRQPQPQAQQTNQPQAQSR